MAGEFVNFRVKLSAVGLGDGALQTLRACHSLLQFAPGAHDRPYERDGKGGERQQHGDHGDQDAAVAAFAFDATDVFGAHAAADAAGVRFGVGAVWGIFIDVGVGVGIGIGVRFGLMLGLVFRLVLSLSNLVFGLVRWLLPCFIAIVFGHISLLSPSQRCFTYRSGFLV